MNTIRSQGIRFFLLNYAGILISGLATLFLYHRDTFAYGLYQTLHAVSSIIAPLLLLGTGSLSVRYYPVFRTEDRRDHGFLGLLLLVVGAGVLVFTATYLIWGEQLADYFFRDKPAEYRRYFPLILPFALTLLLLRFLAVYASNLYKIVIPGFLEQVLIRFTLPGFFILLVLGLIGIRTFIWLVIGSFGFSLAGVILYILWLGHFHLKPDLAFVTPSLRKDMARYGLFGIFSGLGSKFSFDLGKAFVSYQISLSGTGIYAICEQISEVLNKPLMAITSISGPVISGFLKEKNLEKVHSIYQKSSINLGIVGAFIFLNIWLGIDDLFGIMKRPDFLESGKFVVLFIGLGRLVDMITGVNNEIINYSRHYGFNLLALLVLAVCNVFMLMFFMPRYGMVGAAMATFSSLSIFNLLKLFFIYWKFGIHPFTWRTLALLAFCILVFLLAPHRILTGSLLLNLLVNCSLFSLIFLGFVYFLRLSPDLNEAFHLALKRLPFFRGRES